MFIQCRNVDPVDVCAVERSRQYSGTSEANSETSSIASDLSDLSTSKLPTCSLVCYPVVNTIFVITTLVQKSCSVATFYSE